MWILTLLKSAGKHNKVCSACVCVWNGYVLSDNGGDDSWFVSAVFVPPNRYRPGYKLRAISYNRERFYKRCNLYDFDTVMGDVRTEDRGQRSEDRRQRTEDRGQKAEDRCQTLTSEFFASHYLRVRRLTTLLLGLLFLEISLIVKCDTGGFLGTTFFGTFCPNSCKAFLHISLVEVS